MAKVKARVRVAVEYFSGQDEGDTGHPYYVASCDDLMFTTDGETFEELLGNVRDCLILTLQDTDSVREYNVAPNAQVELVMELPVDTYAKTA